MNEDSLYQTINSEIKQLQSQLNAIAHDGMVLNVVAKQNLIRHRLTKEEKVSYIRARKNVGATLHEPEKVVKNPGLLQPIDIPFYQDPLRPPHSSEYDNNSLSGNIRRSSSVERMKVATLKRGHLPPEVAHLKLNPSDFPPYSLHIAK